VVEKNYTTGTVGESGVAIRETGNDELGSTAMVALAIPVRLTETVLIRGLRRKVHNRRISRAMAARSR
jgi:hypothetical protein